MKNKMYKIGSAIIFITLLLTTWKNIVWHSRKADAKKLFRFDKPQNDGMQIFDDIAVTVNKDKCIAVSRKCSHLGCLLKLGAGDTLTCPCHGSIFSNTGRVLKGPAVKALAVYECNVDIKNQKIIVRKP